MFQIDQSGKIENTNQVTVIAFANGKTKSIQIGASEKQKLIKVMRVLDFPKKTYIYKIFSALIYLLLQNEKIDIIEIDIEYPKHEADIKLILTQYFQRTQKLIPEIRFKKIGKKSEAHKTALAVFNHKLKPNIRVKAEEVLIVVYRTKKCWRSQLNRDNP